jgi:predicted DNA-binding protein (MmcQ/YjbR family)
MKPTPIKGRTMDTEQVATFCLELPGAREDYKWGGVRVFSIAETKMFAVMDLAGQGLSFKVDHEMFLGYVDRPGIRPAPYLARAHWISVMPPYALSDHELQDLLTRSHQLVVGKLPKRQQVALKL